MTCKKKQEMKKAKKEVISFTYDELEILGVKDNSVFVRGRVWTEGKHVEVILMIGKTLFKESLDVWLGETEKFCGLNNEFYGQMGQLTAIDYVELSPNQRPAAWPKRRTFKVNSFDSDTGMGWVPTDEELAEIERQLDGKD